MNSEFTKKILKVVSKIPQGKTLSYGEVAKRAGSPKASRVVGNILAKNKDISVPCHRVIRSDGALGSYNNLLGKSKRRILEEEGAI
jgi:O-6-methylguanine DNA methyltransferase